MDHRRLQFPLGPASRVCDDPTMHMNKPASLLTAVLLGSALLTGCGNDKPQVCDDLVTLDQSVDKLDNIQIGPGALDSLETQLGTVRADLDKVKASAKDEFPTQVDQVTVAVDALRESLAKAKANPNVSSLAAVGAAVSSLDDAWENLDDAADATC